eukprot:7270953-Prorocentrum_lima.AAC.1
MPDPPYARAPADTDGGAAVCAHLKGRRKSQVAGNGRKAHALSGALDDTCKLCLPRAQSNGLLRDRPMLDGVHPTHAQPPARGPPGMQAPGEVGVHVSTESRPLVLPREVVDAPRAHNQVTDQPDECCPVCGGGGRHPSTALLSCEAQVRAVQAK